MEKRDANEKKENIRTSIQMNSECSNMIDTYKSFVSLPWRLRTKTRKSNYIDVQRDE